MRNIIEGTSLAVQELRLLAPNVRGPGFNPWSGKLDPTCGNID